MDKRPSWNKHAILPALIGALLIILSHYGREYEFVRIILLKFPENRHVFFDSVRA